MDRHTHPTALGVRQNAQKVNEGPIPEQRANDKSAIRHAQHHPPQRPSKICAHGRVKLWLVAVQGEIRKWEEEGGNEVRTRPPSTSWHAPTGRASAARSSCA